MPNLYGNLSYHGNLKGGMGASLITNVEANPSGDATETLIKIRVGDTIYSIPSGGGGGGGGTTDYNDLTNKPKINDVILTGNLSLSDLGISNPVVMTGATGSSNGVAGYVPQPLIADKDKFLKGDGTWSTSGGGGSDDLSGYTWTVLGSTTGTSSPIPIPTGTKYLVLTSELAGYASIVTVQSIANINKFTEVSGLTFNQGYEYYDIAGNHTYIVMSISSGSVTIRSGYGTVTAKIYALS